MHKIQMYWVFYVEICPKEANRRAGGMDFDFLVFKQPSLRGMRW